MIEGKDSSAMGEGKSKGLRVNAKILNGHPENMITEEPRDYDPVVCGSLGRTNIYRS
ncbi:MAG: hypothetical protein WC067_00370 [Candidatus Methanomethylophilaceae archaeon]